jgi:hypothetical protein
LFGLAYIPHGDSYSDVGYQADTDLREVTTANELQFAHINHIVVPGNKKPKPEA